MKKFLGSLFAFIIALNFFVVGFANNPTIIYAQSEETVYARGGDKINSFSETINYSTRVNEYHVNWPALPGYFSNYTCGITGGVNLIAWYNRLYPLIPNHLAGIEFMGEWVWNGQTQQISDLFPTLYTAMNASAQGVTMSGYLNGLKSYTIGKGKTFTQTSHRNSNGTLNNSYMTAVEDGKLLTLFVDGFNFTQGPAGYSGYDIVTVEEYSGAHILVVYGYYNVSYYNSSSNIPFRQDKYLLVHTGFGALLSWIKLNGYHITIDQLYTTHIS